ncbi:MAG TPA: glycosyltransferase [Ferruginibacter sp.]|nr:glycosyltransferase [Ferruginibacter sp.]
MSDKKTILHIIDYMGRGGAEVMLVKVLKELKEYNNIVVTLNPQNHFGDEFTCDEYHCLHMGSFANLPLAVIKLKSFIKKHKIDLVHSHLFSATLVARMATPSGIPLITTIHTNVSTREYKKWYLRTLEKISYRMHKSTMIGVSAGVLDQYFNFFNHTPYKKYLLYTFVDLGELQKPYQVPDAGVNKEYFTLAAIGALRFPKNQQYLIKAFEKLKGEKFELHIYGIGVLQKELEQLIKESGANVVLKGEAKNASRLLSQYDLYVMPSEFEGFSLSVLEAMAMQIPMLLSDIPSFREQCVDTAVFFDLKDTNDFLAKLKMLAADETLRNNLTVAARKRVLDHFTLVHHMKGLRKIYSNTLNDN